MGPGRRSEICATIERECVSAILRTADQALAAEAMAAAVEGGIRIIEFTLTTPGALELITEFAKSTELTVGAGTVMTPQLAREAVAAGAVFLVSPIVDSEVITEAARLDVPCIPGAHTPTEMETAHRLGVDFIKVFPALGGRLEAIRAIRGPLPHLKLFPTNGVGPDDFIDYLDAGCAGIGFVNTLFEPADLAAHRFDAIRSRAAAITRRLAEWRSAP